jgi:hypothetical protein
MAGAVCLLKQRSCMNARPSGRPEGDGSEAREANPAQENRGGWKTPRKGHESVESCGAETATCMEFLCMTTTVSNQNTVISRA